MGQAASQAHIGQLGYSNTLDAEDISSPKKRKLQ
jgi:hypothetical protein